MSIEDRGAGITPEVLAHIFDPYFTTRRAGTGLGLPIAKNIIEGLGGTVSVSSRVGATLARGSPAAVQSGCSNFCSACGARGGRSSLTLDHLAFEAVRPGSGRAAA